jgi:hypothetical protein
MINRVGFLFVNCSKQLLQLREAKFSSLKAIFNKGKIRLNTRLNTDIDEQFKRWKNWDGTMSDYAQKILRCAPKFTHELVHELKTNGCFSQLLDHDTYRQSISN